MEIDKKLFRKTYKFVCYACGLFTHAFHDYCENCGSIDTFHPAGSQDYN
ncbi:MAG: hypothetical protein ACXABO_18960 [Promethearchaeota archaeon]|jgi:rRNA maturation endonuclease Nob1